MSKLQLKFINNVRLNAIYILDGIQIVPNKKNKYKNYIYEVETEKKELELQIYSIHELSDRFWFLWTIFFFIIGLFGIFNPRYDKRCMDLRYIGKIHIEQDSELTIAFKTCMDGKKALTFKGNCLIEDNDTNVYRKNKTLCRRFRIIKWIKIGIVVFIIILGVILIIKQFIQ